MDFSRVTTRDVLAVMVVAAALLFNGISLIAERGVDAATMTLAGAVVGYYFNKQANGEPLLGGTPQDKLDEPSLPDVTG